jgi:hypothetical protein
VSSPGDLAVDTDGTVYIESGNGIRRVSVDGDIDTVSDLSPSSLALDAHGNLYVAMPDRHKVFVVVRPGELSHPFPWWVLWWGLAVLAVLAEVIYLALRYRGKGVSIGPKPRELALGYPRMIERDRSRPAEPDAAE